MKQKNRSVHQVMSENRLILEALSTYLNHNSRFLDADTVLALATECKISCEEAFAALLSAACGLDSADNPTHRDLERRYLRPSLTALSPTPYMQDGYYQAIKIPDVTLGKWRLCHSAYLPYEPFVWRDPQLMADLTELPQIGYFQEPFFFPAVQENGVDWMTITPNEIETMRAPIAKSHGHVLTLGLGLGYFAFCASERAEVTRVTVVERDENVISLFRTHILPQFPHKEKIQIVQEDAFSFLEREWKPHRFDFLFADLWHDASDGLELYIRLKRLLTLTPHTPVEYWIEASLLSSLRQLVYDKLCASDTAMAEDSVVQCLQTEFLRCLLPEVGN